MENSSPAYSRGFLNKHVEQQLGGHRWPDDVKALSGAFIQMGEAGSYYPVVQIVGEYASQDAPKPRLKLLARAAGAVAAGFAITSKGLTQERVIDRIRLAADKECDWAKYEDIIRCSLARGWKHPWRHVSPEIEQIISQGGRPPLTDRELLTRAKMLVEALETSDEIEACRLASSVHQHLQKKRKRSKA